MWVSFPTSKMVITGKILGEIVETGAFFLNLPEFDNKKHMEQLDITIKNSGATFTTKLSNKIP